MQAFVKKKMKALKTQLETFTAYESLQNGHLGNADTFSHDVILTLFIEHVFQNFLSMLLYFFLLLVIILVKLTYKINHHKDVLSKGKKSSFLGR